MKEIHSEGIARRPYVQPVLVKRDRLARISGDDEVLITLIAVTT